MMMRITVFSFLLGLFTVFAPSYAQDAVSDNSAQSIEVEQPAEGDDQKQEEDKGKNRDLSKPHDLSKLSSLFFTFWEYNSILDAKRSRGKVRAQAKVDRSAPQPIRQEDRIKPAPEKRDITLGGIVYVTEGDWTIWLNGTRVTPNSVPIEIINLDVHNDYIELKWFDEWSNQIYPIRLKAHQRFNIDTRIFLPG